MDTESSRPKPPAGVDWRLQKPVEKNEARESYSLSGFWRLQPTKSMQAVIRPDRWVYIKVPSLWKPKPELYDSELKKTSVLWKPKAEETSPLAEDDDIVKQPNETDDLETARYPCAWYEREFGVPTGPEGRQFMLRFPAGARVVSESWNGIERASDVYVNGHYIGSIRNTKKILEITQHVSLNKSNRISILNGRPWLAAEGAGGFTESPILDIVKPSDVILGEPLIIPNVRERQLIVRLHMQNRSERNIPIRFEAELIVAQLP